MTYMQTRRDFIQTIASLLAVSIGSSAFGSEKKIPLLSFSTLGCPDWTFNQIVDFAVQHHYNGIEIRGILKQLDLTQCAEFSKQNIPSTLQLIKDKGIGIVDLGSSCTLHFPESAERQKNLDEGKHFIDLAHLVSSRIVWFHRRDFPDH